MYVLYKRCVFVGYKKIMALSDFSFKGEWYTSVANIYWDISKITDESTSMLVRVAVQGDSSKQ